MFEQAFKNIDDILWKEAGCTTELDYTEQTSWLLFLKYLNDLQKDKAMEAELTGRSYLGIFEEPFRWEDWAAPRTADGSLDHNIAMIGDDLIGFVDRQLFPYLMGFKQKAEGPNTIEYKIGEVFGEIKNKIRSGYSLRDILEVVDTLRFRSQEEKHELSALYEEKIKRMGNAGRNGGEYYTPRPLIRAIVKVVRPQIGERVYDGAVGSAGFLFLQHFIKYLKAGGRAGVVIKNTFLSNSDNAATSLRKDLLETCNLHTVLDLPGGTFLGAGVKTVVLLFEKGAPTRKVWYYQLDPGRNMGKTNPLNDNDLAEFVKLQADFADSEKSWSVDVGGIDADTWDLSVKNPNRNDEVILREPEEIIEEIIILDGESAEIIQNIKVML